VASEKGKSDEELYDFQREGRQKATQTESLSPSVFQPSKFRLLQRGPVAAA